KVDMTTEEASISNNPSVLMSTVAGDVHSIGYISLGSLNDTVKALKIDGVEASVENINDGSYTISRPFNIATNGDVSDAAQDFIDFIMSADGQAVIEDNGYIKVEAGSAFTPAAVSGKVVVTGSSSVNPVMEKLKEAYEALNPDVKIDLQSSDSSTGMNDAIEGKCDIGMASRDLKDSETEAGLTSLTIAMDGIAVIVNNDNTMDGLTSEQVKDIFTGAKTKWSEVA
ncbi:MAG: extracellular solute-binding protein, partial [Clostridiales bacterium]|nr:extracellular solute-binding protein [Clostridiales bacterium]